MLLWLALCLLARSRRRWWPLGLILVPTLVFTYSRGAWIAVVVAGLLTVAVIFPWGRWLALGMLALTVLVSAAGGAYVVHAFQAGHAGTIEKRLEVWKSAGAMIRDHPLPGIGPDNFIHYYAPTRREDRWQRQCAPGRGYMQPDAGSEPCLSHPHDALLDVWLTAGLLGLPAFIWLQIVFWRQAAPELRPGTGPPRDVLVVGAAGAMAAALIHGLVDQSYFLPDLALIFWALCVLVSRPAAVNRQPTGT
jgi:O-antigen ligase